MNEDIEYDQFRHLAEQDFRWLWVNGYYDGPIDGIVELDGEICHCTMIDENPNVGEDECIGSILLLDLPKGNGILRYTGTNNFVSMWASILFVMKIDLGQRSNRNLSITSSMALIMKNITPDFSNNEIVGWFKT